MKKLLALLLLSSLIFITSCGKTPEEKAEIAIISCNILEASLVTDASQRIKEINHAREELSEEPFLGKDNEITEAINYDLCKELVLNDELYKESLQAAIEQEKIAEEEAREAERIAEEEAREARRIAWKEEREYELEIIKEWAEENKEKLEKIIPLKFVKFTNFTDECLGWKPRGDGNPLVICYEMNNFKGFVISWEVKFKNGYTHVGHSNTTILSYHIVYDFHLDDKTLIDLESANSLKDHVDEVNIYVTGIDTEYNGNNNLLPSEIRALSNPPFDRNKYSYETIGIKYQIYPSP
ncbi:hypothetical protein N9K02_00595 [Gammaproteobacteria bacterium]|nr:hypothetical protein [Gammaproteobacteria bacterium]